MYPHLLRTLPPEGCLTPTEQAMLEDAIREVGSFGKVTLVIEKGRLVLLILERDLGVRESGQLVPVVRQTKTVCVLCRWTGEWGTALLAESHYYLWHFVPGMDWLARRTFGERGER